MFCTACGTQQAEGKTHFCANCGARSDAAQALPAGVAGWSWGAFLLNWIWAIGNRTWIGLLALIPYAGLGVAIWLGIKGREMAWASRPWDSVEHFNRVQKKWSQWAIGIALFSVVIGVLITTLLLDYLRNAKSNKTDDASEEVASVTACASDSQLAAMKTSSPTAAQAAICPAKSDE